MATLLAAMTLSACASDDTAHQRASDPPDAASRDDAPLPDDDPDDADPDDAGPNDASMEDARDDTGALEDAAPDAPPPPPPEALDPCVNGRCWTSLSFGGLCGTSTLNEDFSSGRYNVHALAIAIPADTDVHFEVASTGGAWTPTFILHDEEGQTVHDGTRGIQREDLTVTATALDSDPDVASLLVRSPEARSLTLFLTSEEVVAGDFVTDMPTEVSYTFTMDVDCELPDDGLLTPPNFDPSDQEGGFFLLPESNPPGLYTRKPDGCSRGSRVLIDVIYTMARRWNALRPGMSPINVLDLNEGPCSTVDHATHDDGTHVDITVPCATEVACADNQPAIDLARILVDTGHVCGILFNDVDVQEVVNSAFEMQWGYAPWRDRFMRSVEGHTHHFHIRVLKDDGTCN